MKRIACLLLVLFAGSANAGIIYELDRVVGPGSVVGSITTDGSIGTLSRANITDWELLISDGVDTFTLYGPDNISANSDLLLSGSSFSATATDLLFDFSSYGFALFQNPNPGSSRNWWCIEGVSSNCAGSGDSTESIKLTGNREHVQHNGQVVIASVNNVNVSEPGTIALLGLGLAGFGLSRKKKAS